MTDITIAEEIEDMMTVSEVAKALRVRNQTIYNYIANGMIEAIRIGFTDEDEKSRKHWRIPKRAYEAFVEKGRINGG